MTACTNVIITHGEYQCSLITHGEWVCTNIRTHGAWVCTNKTRVITLHNTAKADGRFFRKLLYQPDLATSHLQRWHAAGSSQISIIEPCDLTFHESCKHASPNPRYQYQNTRRHSTFKWLRAALGRSRHSSAWSWRRNPWVGFQGREGSGTKQGMHTLRPLCLFQTLRCQIGKR